MKKIKSLFSEAAGFYKSSFKWVGGRIPKIVWGTFAVIGILTFGTIFGYEVARQPLELSESEKLATENENLYQLVTGYEDLVETYGKHYKVAQELSDIDKMSKNPTLRNKTIDQANMLRDLMLIQFGSISELRKNAGVPDKKIDNEEFQEEASLL